MAVELGKYLEKLMREPLPPPEGEMDLIYAVFPGGSRMKVGAAWEWEGKTLYDLSEALGTVPEELIYRTLDYRTFSYNHGRTRVYRLASNVLGELDRNTARELNAYFMRLASMKGKNVFEQYTYEKGGW